MTDKRKALFAKLRALLSKTVENGCTVEEFYYTTRMVREARLAERERCALIADRVRGTLRNGGAINACKSVAAAIRGQS